MDKQACNKKKSITEIRDLSHLSAINYSEDYQVGYRQNPNIFKKKDGMMTHLYNAAHRFGESKPFKY